MEPLAKTSDPAVPITPPWLGGPVGAAPLVDVVVRGAVRRVPVPLVVEVEVNSRCNRRCGYCPVSLNPTPDVPRQMGEPVFRRLVTELSGIGFAGRFSYHFYNEPLLRQDLESLVALAKAGLPAARQVLYTNGDLLSPERYASLLDAGVDWFVVTRHDSDPFPERPRQTVLHPSQLVLTNRGGAMWRAQDMLALPCRVPLEMLVVGVDGRVMLCYEDATRDHAFGNLMEQPLLEIWACDELVSLRERLSAGRRDQAAAVCARCDNRAHVSTGMSVYSP